MSCFVGRIYYLQNDQVTLENFWSMVQKENETLKIQLVNKDQFKEPIMKLEGDNPHECLRYDTLLSNIGIISDSYSPNSLHKIKSGFISARSAYAIRLF